MNALPSISDAEFITACQHLERCLRVTAVDCKYIEQDGCSCLILRRSVKDYKPNKSRSLYDNPDDEVVREAEADPARLDVLPLNPWTVPVEYHIMLSPTYRVPVLYFQALYPLDDGKANGVEAILQHLVPPSLKENVSSVGVMGAIGMTEHPISGLSYFFVHPCNTPDALQEVIQDRQVSPSEYLLLWLGLVAPPVGLQLPNDIWPKDVPHEQEHAL